MTDVTERGNCFSADDSATERQRCARRTDCESAREMKRPGEGEREKERARRREGVEGVRRGMGKALVASLVVCLGRHPLAHSHPPFTLVRTRVHTTVRTRSLSLSLFLPLPSSLSPLARSFAR